VTGEQLAQALADAIWADDAPWTVAGAGRVMYALRAQGIHVRPPNELTLAGGTYHPCETGPTT
jgi:hypothetical protein